MNKVISREYIEKNYIHKDKDVTKKYVNMIEAFECDFALARDGEKKLTSLQCDIDNKEEGLMRDIRLLEELSFDLRHGKVKIIKVEETKDENISNRSR